MSARITAMQFLCDYSSDSDSAIEPDSGKNTEVEDFQEHKGETSKKDIEDETKSQQNEAKSQDVAENSAPPPLHSKSLITYSEEYSMNTHKKVSVFLYLPWYPNASVNQRLRRACDKVISVAKNAIPDFDSRFVYNRSVSTKAVFHGKFGHTNTNSIHTLHVSMSPNMYGPTHQLRPMVSNLQRAVRNLEPGLLSASGESKLDAILEAKKVCLQMSPLLAVFLLPKTGSIFVGIKVKKYKDVSSEKQEGEDTSARSAFLDEHRYLLLLTRAICEQADLLHFDYNWAQFTADKSVARNNNALDFHSSLVVCELKPLGKNITPSELKSLRQGLREISDLDKITLETDHLLVQTNNKTHRVKLA